MMKSFSHNTSNQRGKAKIFLLIVVFIIVALVCIKTDYINQGLLYTKTLINKSSSKETIDYYQWTDSNGQMQISQNKPTTTDKYIIFQGSPDFMKSENQVDESLLLQSKEYQTQQSSSINEKTSGAKRNSTKENASSSIYPFSAIDKTKNCVNLSTQITQERNQKKDISALKERYAKEC